jgi:hypothetical protein
MANSSRPFFAKSNISSFCRKIGDGGRWKELQEDGRRKAINGLGGRGRRWGGGRNRCACARLQISVAGTARAPPPPGLSWEKTPASVALRCGHIVFRRVKSLSFTYSPAISHQRIFRDRALSPISLPHSAIMRSRPCLTIVMRLSQAWRATGVIAGRLEAARYGWASVNSVMGFDSYVCMLSLTSQTSGLFSS